ncbi:MAG TPA: thioredoxin [Vicinamibacteria bacterium]|nr:thioredoxin [Vicinamibacteria bacterium]
MSEKVLTLTDGNWSAEVLSAEQPVLVDFWADWCVPCKTLAPSVEAVAGELAGRLKVGKMNVEENSDVPFRYNITSLPTLLLIKGGQVAEQRVGLMSKDKLLGFITPHLG